MNSLNRGMIQEMPSQPAVDDQRPLKESALHDIKPQIGVMISPPPREKGRSIRHCCSMVGQKRVSVERKYDGEYCQVHIDMRKKDQSIKVFSKSGRDSTDDRTGLHATIAECLSIGTLQCKFERQCILEGELLVWHDDRQQIEPFHKIRNHILRAGHFLGRAPDSPVGPHEHLMIMFYDLLLLDNVIYANKPHDKRRRRLWSVVHCVPGQADIGTREKIPFRTSNAVDLLKDRFASAIAQGWEGLVLKGCDDPYFSFNGSVRQIKLKKDYIPGLGDSADMAIVGGRRDARDEYELGLGKLSWTSFYLGCLENKHDVCRFDVKPKFRIVAMVDRHGLSKRDLHHLNQRGYYERVPFARCWAEMEVRTDQHQLRQPTELFKGPMVVEVIGAGFDKPADVGYFTLRFPRVQKVQDERTYKDTVSFDELQEMAHETIACADGNVQIEKDWLTGLNMAEPKHQHADVDNSTISPERSEPTEESVDSSDSSD